MDAGRKAPGGDRLRTHEGGWVRVEGTEDSGKVEPVFNLHVQGNRTYFVAAAENGPAVLVHNDSSPAAPAAAPLSRQSQLRRAQGRWGDRSGAAENGATTTSAAAGAPAEGATPAGPGRGPLGREYGHQRPHDRREQPQ